MKPEDIADAFAYIRAWQPELHRLLLDVAARVLVPVTAVDDCDREPCAHSFLAAALGRLLLEFLCRGVCLGGLPGTADTITRFTENILTEDHGDVANVLRQLEAAGMEQAMEAHPAHRTIAVRSTAPPRQLGTHHRATVVRSTAPPRHRGAFHRTTAPTRYAPPRHRGAFHRTARGARHGQAGSFITHPLDRDLITSRNRRCQGETSR
ncbi:hypothetical protein AB0N88_04710 [Streptomyces sp. NPDC093516]|uniref:hypothetical protein n=1 Tax=Streptomyces sp. NPDC093516 TaxID=3155304 RepID=UPI0034345C65